MFRKLLVAIVTPLVLVPALSAHAEVSARHHLGGIDVSHWQGTIDWNAVSGAGVRFVFAKATEGQTFDDPNYSSYKVNAEAERISFTAYHFARPDSGTNDAVLEADHFFDVANLVSGNLIPALDLEDSGGLSTTALTNWVFDWLAEVEVQLGVKPMIYTSPSFWEGEMGDTQAFADAGYSLLWIANWDVPRPKVPGNNWGGFGWTFWQRTDCMSIPGINGCVDGDVYHGSSLRRVRIP